MRPRGIGGDRFATEPVDAVLRVGKKSPRGNPTETDRFFIADPIEVDGVRPLHPSFAAYNQAEPDKRRLIRANLVHETAREAVDLARIAYRLTEFPSGTREPSCRGDGRTAERWIGGEKQVIKCPGDLCQFAQKGQCKVFLKVLFRPRWNDSRWPAPLMKYTSRGEHMLSSLYGLFDHVAGVAHGLGLCPSPEPTQGMDVLDAGGVSVFGMPFSISLASKTNKRQRTRFPVVRFAPDGDLLQWLLGQREARRQLAEASPQALPPATVDTDAIDVDLVELEPGIGGRE